MRTALDEWRWLPGRKPFPQHVVEINPASSMTVNLISCIAFDSCCLNGGGCIRDYSQPSQVISVTGTAFATTSPYGGGAFNTIGSGTADYLAYATAIPTTVMWSVSFMAKFNGTIGSGSMIAFGDAGNSNGIAIATGNSEYTDISSSVFFTPAVTTFTTWTRHTFTSDGTTVSFYSNGRLQSTTTFTTNMALSRILWDWPFPTSDFFMWNRTLTPLDVATHNADPFGTTLRTRYSVRPQVMVKQPYIQHPQLQPIQAI